MTAPETHDSRSAGARPSRLRPRSLTSTGVSMPHRFRRRFLPWLAALASLALALVAGCAPHEYPQTSLHPESDYARAIQGLVVQQVMWVTIIFTVVLGLLIVVVVRFRDRPGAGEPSRVHGNTALEIAWTIAPAIILALVAIPTVAVIFKTQTQPPADAVMVKAIGHQWWWEFQYPKLGIVTASEMHAPVGRPVIVDIESADVIHSFWIPAIGGKRDAIPTHTNRLWFTADSVGVYPGTCAELCGLSHANMRMKLFVQSPQDFDAWVARQKAPPVEPDSGSLAWQGKSIFSQSACIGCHTISGVSEGALGPNLTHVGGRTAIAGAIYPNTPENMARWITDPPTRKPGSLMPNLGLTKDQVNALVTYLQSLK